MKSHHQIICLGIVWLIIGACNKDAFLSAKPDNGLLVPKTVADYQLVLDADIYMNGSSTGITPDLVEAGEDNYYVPDAAYNGNLLKYSQDCYTWADKPYPAQSIASWNNPYICVYYANFVLDGLSNITSGNTSQEWMAARGSALFYRAYAFYQLAQAFAPAYDQHVGDAGTGIPLLLHGDVNQKIERASVQQTYDRIFADVKEASTLLPSVQLTYLTRPSRAACFALLARTYQTIQQYDSAYKYANAALQLQNTLMDYNDYPSSPFHFPRFPPEVIFHALTRISADSYGNIDSVLYNSYDSNDLRKTYFFNLAVQVNKFVGSYDGTTRIFGGLATDELYLIRAECLARSGSASPAMSDLNTLLIKRFKKGKFIAYSATDARDALNKILLERRKELCFRGLRWTDIRRLNKEGAGITIKRIVNGVTYTLTPESPKWVWPIPDDVLSFNPGMLQNPR